MSALIRLYPRAWRDRSLLGLTTGVRGFPVAASEPTTTDAL